jgi:YD repeat-containing protein
MIIFTSCAKKKDIVDPPPPTALPPLRVEKSIITWGLNRDRDTTVYQYNADGLLTRIIDEDNSRVLTEIQYQGGRISEIKKLIDDRLTPINFRVSNPLDTFHIEWQLPDGSGITNQEQTLVYQDSLLHYSSFQWTYSDGRPSRGATIQYIYDLEGGLIRYEYVDNRARQATYTETDNVKNINFLMGPLWALFAPDANLDAGTGRYAVQSLVNPFGEMIEFEWTTNSEGYPTSVRYKNHPDWESYEYIYNR